MNTKTAMAAQFTQVTLEDMEKFLKRGFRALRPKQSIKRREIVFDLKLGSAVGIRVWTSIHPGSGVGAVRGADAIRVQLISLKDDGPLEKGKAPIVKRTQRWRISLQDRIEELAEKYEDREEFWEDWASTRGRKGDPEKEIQRQEIEQKEEEQRKEEVKQEMRDKDTAHPPEQTYQREVPLQYLKGDSTPKQQGFILGMLRRTQESEWLSLGLEDLTGLSWPLSKRDVESLSKRDASQVIDRLLKAGKGRRYASEEGEDVWD